MDGFHHLLECHGRYRLLALHGPTHLGAISGYAIITLAGDLIFEAPTLAQARVRIEQLVADDLGMPRPSPPRVRITTLRR